MVKSVERLTTKPEILSLKHSPDQKVFKLSCVHPTLNGQLSLFRLSESKGDKENDRKLPHNVVCQGKSVPHSWFPYARIKFWTHMEKKERLKTIDSFVSFLCACKCYWYSSKTKTKSLNAENFR